MDPSKNRRREKNNYETGSCVSFFRVCLTFPEVVSNVTISCFVLRALATQSVDNEVAEVCAPPALWH